MYVPPAVTGCDPLSCSLTSKVCVQVDPPVLRSSPYRRQMPDVQPPPYHKVCVSVCCEYAVPSCHPRV